MTDDSDHQGSHGYLTAPFFAAEGSDVTAYESLAAMAKHIEAYDVNVHEFYDASGMPLAAVTEGYQVVGFRARPGALPERNLLEQRLRQFLAMMPEPHRTAATEARSLEELVATIAAQFHVTH